MNIHNVKIGHSALSNSLYLYRHGKNEAVALEKRECESDVFIALVQYMMHEAPNGAVKTVFIDGAEYEIKVVPKEKLHA